MKLVTAVVKPFKVDDVKAALKAALPQMTELLAQDKHATHTLESGG